MIRVSFPPAEQFVRQFVQLRQGAGLAEDRRGINLQALIDSIAKGETVFALSDGGYLLGRMTPLVNGSWGFTVDEVRVLPQFDTPAWWQDVVTWLIEFCHYAGAVQVLASAWDTDTAALYRDKLHLQSEIVIMAARVDVLQAGLSAASAPPLASPPEEVVPDEKQEQQPDPENGIAPIVLQPTPPQVLQAVRQTAGKITFTQEGRTVQPRLRGVKMLGKGA